MGSTRKIRERNRETTVRGTGENEQGTAKRQATARPNRKTALPAVKAGCNLGDTAGIVVLSVGTSLYMRAVVAVVG